MKIKHILTLFAGAMLAFTSCVEEDPVFGGDDAFVATPSIINVGKDGGSQTVEINTTIAWSVETNADWITVDPKSGVNAAKITVTVAKNEDENARQASVEVKSMGNSAFITVKQAAGGIEYGTKEHPYPASKAYDFAAALDADAKSDEVYITGIIAKIDEKFGTQFGNATFYITDDGQPSDKMFEVYRTLYLGNKKYDNEADQNINLGDKVLIYGKCTNYKGNTPETVQNESYVVSIEEGTTPILEVAEKTVTVSSDVTSAEFDLTVKNLTADWTVTPAETYDWITDYTKSGKESGKISFTLTVNEGDPRTAKFTVASTGAQSVELTLTQNGAVLPATIAELIASIPETATGSSTKAGFEANLKEAAVVTYVNGGTAYIEDATGAVILYNSEHGLVAGNTIKGKISGDCYWYNGAPEILGLGTAYEKGEGAAPAPKEITLAELNANYAANLIRFVTIKGVTVSDGIADGDRNGEITQGEAKLAVYAQINNGGLSLTAGSEGDITGIVGCYYKGETHTDQLLFWDNSWFSQTGGPVEVPEMYLNEFDCQNKKIEIYNATDAEVDMTGWIILKNDGEEGEKDTFVIPAALAKVPAKGFAVFTCKQSDAANGPLFGLSGTKGFKIALMMGNSVVDLVDNLTTVTEIPDGKSWGRETDGAENFVIFDTPTIGESNGTTPPPPAPTTIAEVIAAIPSTATGSSSAVEFEVDIAEPATVSYVNGKNAYLEDATGAILLYLDNHGLQAGYTVKGKFTVKAYRYGGIPEIVAISGGQPTVGAGTAITPKDITLADLLANYDANLLRIVKISGVKVTKAFENKNAEISQGDNTIVVRDQKGGLTLTANDEGDIISIVGCYNTTKQLFFWQDDWFTSTATDVPPTITAADITGVPAAGVTDATATVSFANADGWTASVTPDGTVVTAASIDGTTIKYTVAENTATEARDGKITIALKKEGKDDVTKEIKVSQKAAEGALDPSKTYYKKVTEAPADWSGKYLLVADKNDINKAFKGFSSTSTVYGEGADVTITSSAIESTETTDAYQIVIAKATVTEGAYTIKFGDNFFTWTSGNSLNKANAESVNTNWNITYVTDHAVIRNAADATRNLQWNASSPRFACYGNDNQTVIQLYKLEESETPATGSDVPDYDPITGFTW